MFPERTSAFSLACHGSLALGSTSYAKLSRLPRFILVNNLARRLCFREHGGEPPGNSNLEPEAQTSLLFMRPRDEKMLTITYPGLNAQWCAIHAALQRTCTAYRIALGLHQC